MSSQAALRDLFEYGNLRHKSLANQALAAHIGYEPLLLGRLLGLIQAFYTPQNIGFHRGQAIVLSLSQRHVSKEFKMVTGKVKWYNPQKGYGFIAPDDGGKDVFVHATALEAAGLRGLNDGQAVSFETQMDRGKASAAQLKVS